MKYPGVSVHSAESLIYLEFSSQRRVWVRRMNVFIKAVAGST